MKKSGKLTVLLLLLIVIGCAAFYMSNQKVDRAISIATGATSGTYYPLGSLMASLITNELDGWVATAEVTGASVENVRLVETAKAELAMANANAPYFAIRGEPPFEKKYENIRAMMSHHPSGMQLVALADSGITKLEDLKGKRVNIGAPGGATEIMAWDIMEAAGFTRDDVKPMTLSLTEVVEAFKDNSVDAAFMLSGYPMSALIDLYSARDVVMLSIPDEILTKLSTQFPYYTPVTIAAGTYEGMKEDVKTNCVWNIVICNKDLPDDFVYNMLNLFFENYEGFVNAHPMGKYMTLENATVGVPIPWHPGAEKWLKEKGAL